MAGELTVLKALYEAYNAHDAEAAGALYAADGVHEDVATQRPQSGHTAIATGLRGFLAAFPDAQWTCLGSGEADGTAFSRYVLTGSLQGDLGPIRAGGQPLQLRGVHVLQVRDGRIEKSEDYWDMATFQRQMNTHH